MNNVKNPIIIDQGYCPNSKCSNKPVSLICREWVKELDFWRIEQRLAKNSSVTEHETARNYG